METPPPPDRHTFQDRFSEALRSLNTAQREAVYHIEGPVLVVAGPGTGKTHVLAARIGLILQETDTQANNILCLTFTEAGAHAMRQRLLQWIGPEGHKVHIYTFHSFCNSVIQDNLEYFGRSDLEPLGDLERVEIVRRLLDNLENGHPLRRRPGDPYFYEAHLHDLFKRIKAENWAIEDIYTQINTYLQDLPSRAEFIYQTNNRFGKKGDIKEKAIEVIVERMEKLRAAVALFPAYAQALHQARRYDYEDMILWVLQAFAGNEALLRNYQEQYLYILVDEYQDTNGAQNAILQYLINYWEQPNIFIVGDDDQSIYEFQGARLKNLEDFYHQYRQHLKLVALNDNYRSSQHILDWSGQLIDHNQRRIIHYFEELGISKILNARNDEYAGLPLLPRLNVFANKAQEEAHIVSQIKQLYDSGFPLEETAILYARHRQARNFITLLERQGIPYQTRRRMNVLELPLIVNLRNWLEYLQAEFVLPHSGEYLLFRILHFAWHGLSAQDLARLSSFFNDTEKPGKTYWRNLLGNEALLRQLHISQTGTITALAALIDQLLSDLVNMPVIAFLEKLINRSGLLAYVLRHDDKIWLLQVLKTFFDFVKEENERNPRLTLRRLLDILRHLDDNRLAIEINKNISDNKGIQLITAHSAKGLEFRRVFMPDCTKDQWEPQRRTSNNRFALPDTLTLSGEEDAMEARRRLFYVAMTRAQEELYLSYSLADAKETPLQRAIFVEELCARTGAQAQTIEVAPEVIFEAEWLQMKELDKPRAQEQEKASIDELLKGFSLSISALNRYLRCPLSFYYEHILRAPTLQSEAASYGIAAHFALQRLFDRMLSSRGKGFPGVNEFIGYFEQALDKQKARFGAKEYERRLEWGRRQLHAYYQQHLAHWEQQVRVELNIRQAESAGVPINGVIDKVILHDNLLATVADYKTGSHDPAKLRPPGGSLPYGGAYWRQLVFYKLLYESYDRSSRQVTTGLISYLDPDAKGHFFDYTLKLSADDASFMRNLISDTYQRILQHDFYTGCGRAECPWCRLARSNQSADSFSDEEIEALDD